MLARGRSERRAAPEAPARYGSLTHGIVYVLIGGIAARVAILQHGETTGSAGALARVLTGSGGKLPFRIVVAGLFAFVLFRVVQGVRARQCVLQVFCATSGLGGLVLAIAAVPVHLRFRSGADDAGPRELGARVVSHAWGRLGLELGGVIAIVVGAVEAVRAVLGRLPADFTAAIMARAQGNRTSVVTRAGMLAVGIVVAIIGFSVCRAGLDENARALGGTGAALRTLRHFGSGPVLIGRVAVGLMVYGPSLLVLAARPPSALALNRRRNSMRRGSGLLRLGCRGHSPLCPCRGGPAPRSRRLASKGLASPPGSRRQGPERSSQFARRAALTRESLGDRRDGHSAVGAAYLIRVNRLLAPDRRRKGRS